MADEVSYFTLDGNLITLGGYTLKAFTPGPEPIVFDTVTLPNGQTWMSKNLMLDDGGEGIRTADVVYDISGVTIDLGKQYYYTWDAAKRIANSTSASGWHLPTRTEFLQLSAYNNNTLKAVSSWSNNGNGTDDYGFTIYAAGQYKSTAATAKNNNLGVNACFWSVDQYTSTTDAVNAYIKNTTKLIGTGFANTASYYNSVRLIQDT